MKRIWLLLGSLAIIALACDKEEPMPTSEAYEAVKLFDLPEEPFTRLSDYGFFEGEMNELNPHPTLIPYSLPTELFSNYATKQRFVYMPPGKKASYLVDEQRTLEFPDSTVIIKTFYYENDFRDASKGQRVIETRLLIKRAGVWEQAEYIWNDAQTDANFNISGRQVEVDWIHFDGSERSTLYSIPNHNECKGCHELGSEQVLLGPKVRYLNSDFDYSSGTQNQLEYWMSIDRLDQLPAGNIPRVAALDDESESLELRARSYLDINCAHCHNAEGPANNTSLFLSFNEVDSLRLGFCKAPIAAGSGSGGLSFSIVPGNAENSILVHRLNSLEIDVSMPELGRSVIHEEGLQLLRDWINSFPGDCE